MTRTVWVVLVAVLVSACSVGGGSKPPQATITVFAASSLKATFDGIGRRLLTEDNVATDFSYAGSQTLASQITQGAPADVFASADTTNMDIVMAKGFATESRTFAFNRLEIVVARGNPKGIHGLTDLARKDLVVVLADPSVPAGRYAAQALSRAAITVHPASLEQSVAGVLNKVALGEADTGIVYATDVAATNKVQGVAIPRNENIEAAYQIAVLKGAEHRDAARLFLNLVVSKEGQAILKAAGFEGV